MLKPRNAALEFALQMEALKKAGLLKDDKVPVKKETIIQILIKYREAKKMKWRNYIQNFNKKQLKDKPPGYTVTDVSCKVIKTVIHDGSNQRNAK